jgi:hypothetical protein
MAHKYKIGAVVHYNPGQKSVRALGKRYTIIAFMPKTKGEPTYEIKHDNGDKRVARESELRQSPHTRRRPGGEILAARRKY